MLKITSAILSMLLVYSSCKPTEFSGGGAAKRSAKVPQKAEESRKSQTFPLSSSQGAVDIVWAIDTSGSMDQEINHVQTNFAKFVASLSAKTDVKLTLIADQSAIALSSALTTAGHRQVASRVGSHDALGVLATKINDPRLGLLRPGAKPVFVVVTDDDARTVTNANFLSMIAPTMGEKKPVVYAFRGDVSRAGCGVASKGRSYESLATTTGGQVFDICDADWSKNFAQLVDAVASLTNNRFAIEDPLFSSILAVRVDGQNLPAEAYQVEGQTLVLTSKFLPSTAKELQIDYMATTNVGL
jgi:hypothetical protein